MLVNLKLFVLPITFVALLVLAVVGIILNYRFLTLLKVNQPEKWKELGSPTLIFNSSIKTNLAIFKFLKNKEYQKINNPILTKISKLLWYCQIVYLIFFTAVLLLFLLVIIFSTLYGTLSGRL